MALNCSTQALLWGSSWGAGWGGPSATPGGALPAEAPFSTFCVCGVGAPYLGTYIGVTETPADLDHNQIDVDKGIYRLLSLDGTRAGVYFDVSLTTSATLEMIFTAPKAPIDLSAEQEHLFVGLYDDSFSCMGLFLSQAGLAYGASYDDKPLSIPNSSGLIVPGENYVLRIVLDGEANVAMVYLSTLEKSAQGGPKLLFILPLLSATYAPAHAEGVYVSVLGQSSHGVTLEIDAICVAPSALVDDHPPVADPGKDLARRGLAPVCLDGRKSFDPEGGALTYRWRVVGVPEDSAYHSQGADGSTLASVSGYTAKLYSEHAAGAEAFSFSPGDVLAVQGIFATLVTTGTDGDGDYFLVEEEVLPENLSGEGFTLYRQSALDNALTSRPLLHPDTYGLYRVQLQVRDAALFSSWTTVLVNVLRKEAATGVIPDVSYIWRYLSDTWSLVPDAGRLETLWTAAAQVVGAETLRLWQAGASKSLQEIPRSVTRRWLNYDLLMREPFIDMTVAAARFEGVASSEVAFSGLAVEGESLVLSVPGWTDLVEISFSAASTPKGLAADLRTDLLAVDPRFSVEVILLPASATAQLLVTAPFPFSVVAGTTALFTVGLANEPLQGIGCSRESANILKVDKSLLGRGLRGGDLLRVEAPEGPVVLTVASTVNNEGDTYPHQRIRTQEEIPPGTEGTWAILLKLTSPQMNFWSGGATLNDPVVVDGGEGLFRTELAGIVEGQPSSVGVVLDSTLADLLAPVGARLRLWGVYRRSYLPVSERVQSIPTLQVNPWEEEEAALLREHIDYEITSYRGSPMLHFQDGVFFPDEQEVVVPRLWAEETVLDNSEVIEANFGIKVGLLRGDVAEEVDYLSAVKGLQYALSRGPRLESLRVATQILLGLPFAEERSTILEVEESYTPGKSRLLLQDKADPTILRSYVYNSTLPLETNPKTQTLYKVGDEVAQFAPLVAGAAVLDHRKDPLWSDVYTKQGLLSKLEAIHSYLVRVEVTSSLSTAALLFVSRFLQRVKGARTRPLFLVRLRDLDPDDIDVSENLEVTGQLLTYDSPYAKPFSFPGDDSPNVVNRVGSAGMFDQPDLSPPLVLANTLIGRTRAQFDRSIRTDVAPALPHDPAISWGMDLGRFAPEQLVSLVQSYVHAGGNIPAELEAELDVNQPLLLGPGFLYGRSWTPGFNELGLKLEGPEDPEASYTFDTVGIRIVGTPPPETRDYIVRIYVDGVLAREFDITHSVDGTQVWWWGPSPAGSTIPGGSLSVTSGASIKVGIFCLPEERIRQRLRGVSVVLGEGQSWTSGGPLSAGTYYLRRALLGCVHALLLSQKARPADPCSEQPRAHALR